MEQNLEWYNPEYIESEELKYLLGMERSRIRGLLYTPTLHDETTEIFD
jgi:hypothetical protein